MTIKKTTPYGCEIWHPNENDFCRIRKVIYQKEKFTYCVDSNYDIRYSKMSFDKAYSIAIKNKAFFEYDAISNENLQYMSNILYEETINMIENHNNQYCNETARNIYNDITNIMKIHNFINPSINFATLTTIENAIKMANNHIAENDFIGLDIERIIEDELHKEYYKLNNEMQTKIKNIIFYDKHTYRDIDDIIKQIKEW